jgi:predicted dehydrogenase
MKAIVIGLGSMGKRRIRLLRQSFFSVELLGVDKSESRRKEAADLFEIEVFSELEDALAESCDCAFVCTAPLAHAEIISICLSAGLHVFSELNLVRDGYVENIRLAAKKQRTLFISSTMLYRPDIQYLIEYTKGKEPLIYTYHVGQYLPDWHPWESFNDFFVGDKRTGGCREILAIELPWLLRAFGEVAEISVKSLHASTLQLPYPDTYLIQMTHKSGALGQFLVDVLTRVPVRHFEAFGENLQLEWRGKPEEVWAGKPDYSAMKLVDLKNTAKRQSGYRDFIVEDAYSEEIAAFFNAIDGVRPTYNFEDDVRTLRLVDKIMGAEF